MNSINLGYLLNMHTDPYYISSVLLVLSWPKIPLDFFKIQGGLAQSKTGLRYLMFRLLEQQKKAYRPTTEKHLFTKKCTYFIIKKKIYSFFSFFLS